MKNVPKETTVNTSNLQPGELIQMDFTSYRVTSINEIYFHDNCPLCKDYNDMVIPYYIQNTP